VLLWKVMQDDLKQHNLMKEFRVQELVFMDNCLMIRFYDNPGTMKKFHAFVDYFFPLLRQAGALDASVCTECGQTVPENEGWVLVNGMAFHLHESCAKRIEEQAIREEELTRAEETGSYATGLLGSLLGALLGAIVWAVVLYFGYFASVVGLLIGYLSEKLYGIFGGRNGKGKLIVLVVAALVGVVAGTLGADVITVVSMIHSGELYGLAYGDILPFIIELLIIDGEYLSGTLMNVGLGLIFAFLGMWGVLKKTRQENASFQMKKLK